MIKRRGMSASALCAFAALMLELFTIAAQAISKTEEVEWTWNVRPAHANPTLPNVLLVGDSVARNYFPVVVRDLAGTANVYLLANSICIGDPRLPAELQSFFAMEGVRFEVIHFNNGMHGWNYSESEYKGGFPQYLKAIKHLAPRAVYIWTTTTPIKKDMQGGASNERITARNAIAATFTRNMLVDDQHALMLTHPDLYQDDVHFNPAGSTIEGDEAAARIKKALVAKHFTASE